MMKNVPYDASPLTDHDIYLFGEGSNFRLYEKLGLSGTSRCTYPSTLPENLVMVRKNKPQSAQRNTESCYFCLTSPLCSLCPLWLSATLFRKYQKVPNVLVTATRDTKDPKLGSHTTTINNIQGTFFAVWAPNAKYVSAIGDFNNWSMESHPLRLRDDRSGIREGFIPGVREGALYKVGAPAGSFRKEVLNSDAKEYGGSGHGNLGGVEAAPIPCHGRYHPHSLTLPPLGILVFKKEDQ